MFQQQKTSPELAQGERRECLPGLVGGVEEIDTVLCQDSRQMGTETGLIQLLGHQLYIHISSSGPACLYTILFFFSVLGIEARVMYTLAGVLPLSHAPSPSLETLGRAPPLSPTQAPHWGF